MRTILQPFGRMRVACWFAPFRRSAELLDLGPSHHCRYGEFEIKIILVQYGLKCQYTSASVYKKFRHGWDCCEWSDEETVGFFSDCPLASKCPSVWMILIQLLTGDWTTTRKAVDVSHDSSENEEQETFSQFMNSFQDHGGSREEGPGFGQGRLESWRFGYRGASFVGRARHSYRSNIEDVSCQGYARSVGKVVSDIFWSSGSPSRSLHRMGIRW